MQVVHSADYLSGRRRAASIRGGEDSGYLLQITEGGAVVGGYLLGVSYCCFIIREKDESDYFELVSELSAK